LETFKNESAIQYYFLNKNVDSHVFQIYWTKEKGVLVFPRASALIFGFEDFMIDYSFCLTDFSIGCGKIS
jgi:hypothetical protein